MDWGRGFDKIRDGCNKYDGPLPEYDISEEGVMVQCKSCDRYLALLRGETHPVQIEQDDEQDMVKAIIKFCEIPRSSKEIVEHFKFPNRSYFKRHYMDELLNNEILKMTEPDKPSSRNQKYYSERENYPVH